MPNLTSVFLIFTFAFSTIGCSVKKITSNQTDPNQITENELIILSNDCDYVMETLKRNTLEEGTNSYKNDLRIVKFIEYSPCLEGLTIEECIKILSVPTEIIKNKLIQTFTYKFIIEDKHYKICSFDFKDGISIKQYCSNVKEVAYE